jgi:glucose/arabinose dehydrogenase
MNLTHTESNDRMTSLLHKSTGSFHVSAINIKVIVLVLMTVGIFMNQSLFASTEAIEYVQIALEVQGETRMVRIPKGYELEILTDQLKEPRMLTFHKNGDLFAGSRSGNVYRFVPPYRTPEVLVKLDDYPHSVAFRSDEIFIAQNHGLYRALYRAGLPKLTPESLINIAELPGGFGHSSRTVGIGPDMHVYLSLGISGNCSDEYLGQSYPFNRRRGGVLVLDEDKRQYTWKAFTSGLRNPVGFDWHPQTKVLYASNNGPDHLGFNLPPEYFSLLKSGSFHGMPWFYYDGQEIKRDSCITGDPPRPKEDVVKPVATFPARNAPLGVVFVPVGAMDTRFEGDAVVALHGSWATRILFNPATRRHPKVVIVRFKNGAAKRVDDLITGFQLENGDRWARPAGVAVGPDGALYFTSDSEANGLFRLKRIKQNYTLTIKKSGSGDEDVSSTPGGIDCGNDCTENYGEGTKVTLTAGEESNSPTVIWFGCDSTSGNTCSVTMNSDKTVTAVFNKVISTQLIKGFLLKKKDLKGKDKLTFILKNNSNMSDLISELENYPVHISVSTADGENTLYSKEIWAIHLRRDTSKINRL